MPPDRQVGVDEHLDQSEGYAERCYYCPYCGQKLSPAQYSDFPPKTLNPGELPL